MGFVNPTPIQEQSIPIGLKGLDILGSAQTGTGKTAAFGIPIIENLNKDKNGIAVILAPTRELAKQIYDVIRELLGYRNTLKVTALIGGESITNQLRNLKRGPRIIIGTPGRINDHINRKSLYVKKTKILVLDETDRIGYVDGISKIFINALDQLDINQRPVHCRDTKRETVYIRHENQWEKENFANVKLTNAIGHIVKMLQNIWKQRLIVKSQQANKSYDHPTTLIDVSEVTNAPRIDGTTIQESNTYYKRISRNIMKESIIEK